MAQEYKPSVARQLEPSRSDVVVGGGYTATHRAKTMLLKIVDGLCVAAISAFALYSVVFIFVMWRIRHTFFIAMR